MATTTIPLPTLDWSNENKQEAFSEWVDFTTAYLKTLHMHKKQKQFNPSGIKWPTVVDMPLNKTQTQLPTL